MKYQRARKQTANPAAIKLHAHLREMARYSTDEAVELLFGDQLVDSGDEDDIPEALTFPLPREDNDELDLPAEELLPQISSTPPTPMLDLSREVLLFHHFMAFRQPTNNINTMQSIFT